MSMLIYNQPAFCIIPVEEILIILQSAGFREGASLDYGPIIGT
nr:hypothetical protein [uncultured Mucilaginibacter sp.]